MSKYNSNFSFYGYLKGMDHIGDAGQESDICIPLVETNGVFHVASVILHFLQMNEFFRGKAHEVANLYLNNFVSGCLPFDIAYITQKSILLCIFPFSLMGKEVLWLRSLFVGSITSCAELIEAFLDRYFPPSRMLQ